MPIRIECQTDTWQMSGGVYDGRLDHIIKVTAKAGFAGVEPETRFLGRFADPDLLAGHMAKGGMDPLTIIQRCFPRVVHVHDKDMDRAGKWAPMGGGAIDHEGITRFLTRSGYEGWIVVEDECHAAIDDPDGVTVADSIYARDVLTPLTIPTSAT